MFRGSDRTWYYDFDHNGTTDDRIGPWANEGDLPIAGDFDRDGVSDDVAVFRPSDRTWYYDYSHDGTTDSRVPDWANRGDLPFAGDLDGDGQSDDVGVWRESDGIKYIDLNHDGTTDAQAGACPGESRCLPVVVPEAGRDHIMLFCAGMWWPKVPGSLY